MKKIIVVSDSHRHRSILESIFAAHPDIDTCIHCGDLQDEPTALDIAHFYVVRGNNDFANMENELFLTIENQKIYVTHGHLQQIESGLDTLMQTALKHDVHLVLYGHTHCPTYQTLSGITFLNPGSVAFPRGSQIFAPTYAIVTLSHDIECRFYHAKTHEDLTQAITTPKQKTSFFARFRKRKTPQ